MERTSLVINITFTGFIMLSIAQMAISRLDQVVDASGPYETAKVERDGTLVADFHDGAVHNEGKTGANAANGLASVNDDGEGGVDLKNGQVKTNARPTGANVAGGLADVNRSGDSEVDLNKGEVNKGGETKVYAANGLVDVKKGEDKTVDLRKGEVQKGGIPANKDAPVPENTYPANNDVPATKNNDENYN
ncbi:hypothetical protein MKW98_024511 [Papaver atlanticum]|uniref:Uncharacterized protein n=1 Tax=Papaver atlanticum TaxID=357466 RepID=A0AAD4RV18_9MAGN|nr:hypothetical protein MKW98_024511 [Papaver atlanticum]